MPKSPKQGVRYVGERFYCLDQVDAKGQFSTLQTGVTKEITLERYTLRLDVGEPGRVVVKDTKTNTRLEHFQLHEGDTLWLEDGEFSLQRRSKVDA